MTSSRRRPAAAPAAPPPRAGSVARVPLSTRLLPEISERMHTYVQGNDTSVQAVVEAALDEYLSARKS